MTEVDFEILEAEAPFKASAKAEEAGEKKKDPFHYQHLAEHYLMDVCESGKSFIQYYQGRTLRYDGRRYLVEHELGHRLRRWFRAKQIPANNTVVGNVIPWIESLALCEAQKYPQLPFWRGESLCDPKSTIAFANGILDVEQAAAGNHGLIPHTYNWVSLTCLPYDYDPQAACPRWIAFLEDVLEGDQGRIELLQEFFGYSMVPDNSLQKMLALKGVSRGGKGTVVKVLEAVLGGENVTGYTLTALAERFGLCGLVGKLVATIGEVNLQKNQDKYTIFQALNMIVGNDPVEIEYKHQALKMSVRLPVRFVISCNEMPKFSDDSGAMSERLLVIDFEKACPPEKRDPTLAEKLIAEASGIANWSIGGLARLRSNGKFTVPAKMQQTLNEIRRENSPTLAFAQDRLVVHRHLDTGNLPGVEIVDDDLHEHRATCKDVGDVFDIWCQQNDCEGYGQRFLARNLKTIFPKLESRPRRNIVGEVVKTYVGLKLKEAVSPSP
jgi:putative DNA primase/helicase